MKEEGNKIIFKTGDMFKSEWGALVNPTNCRGLIIKDSLSEKFDEIYTGSNDHYRTYCSVGFMKPGSVYNRYCYGEMIVYISTRDNPRDEAKMKHITDGLRNLVTMLDKLPHIKSVAIPALGCRSGNLKWRDVRATLVRELSDLSHKIKVVVFRPVKDKEGNGSIRKI